MRAVRRQRSDRVYADQEPRGPRHASWETTKRITINDTAFIKLTELARVQRRHVHCPNSGEFGYRLDRASMTRRQTPKPAQDSSNDALRVLEVFAATGHVAFDRIHAGRALSEAERAIPGNDCDTWSQRLIEVGESLNLPRSFRRMQFPRRAHVCRPRRSHGRLPG